MNRILQVSLRALVTAGIISASMASCTFKGNTGKDEACRLAAHFETVMYANRDIVTAGGYTARIVTGPILRLFNGILGKNLTGLLQQSTRYILFGARRFRPPENLGSVKWDGCYLIVLRSAEDALLSSQIKTPPVSRIGERPVWRLEQIFRNTDHTWELFAVQIRATEILMATSLALLNEIASTVESKDAEKIYRYPEWRELDFNAPLWAVRRYRHDEAVDRMAAGLSFRNVEVDQSAIALTFWYDGRKGLFIRYLGAGNGSGPLQEFQELGISAKRIRSGVWQTEFPVEESRGLIDKLALVLGMFGFAVYS